ncbi:MAG: GNAT family N-acetyltransferase [Dehalococcoidales bacterium]
MNQRSGIETKRLILRPFVMDDVGEVRKLVADRDIAATTSDSEVPQPDMTELWIRERAERFGKGESFDFAIVQREKNLILGAIGLGFEHKNDESMQLGYWLGKQYWNQGYCTEAARAVIRYGFEELGLNRNFSRYFASNPASGRVMEKTGMKYEGTMREAYKKGDKFEDLVCYSILRSEYTSFK